MKRALTLCGILLIGCFLLVPVASLAQTAQEPQPAPSAPADPAAPAPEIQKAAEPAPAPVPAPEPAKAPEKPKENGILVGIGDMKVSGIFQAIYKLTQVQVGTETDWKDSTNSFLMKRARVFLIGTLVKDKIKYVFQGDAVNEGSLSGDSAAGYKFTGKPWLLDARIIFVNALPNTEIQIGRFLPNFTYYMPLLVSKLDFIEYPLVTSKYAMWRQLGVQSTTKIPMGSFNLGVFNSLDYNAVNTDNWADNDTEKDYLARINLKPIDNVEAGAYFTYGNNKASSAQTNFNTCLRAGGFLRATAGGLTALAEGLYSKEGDATGYGLVAQAGYKVIKEAEVMARFDMADQDTDLDTDGLNRVTAGAVYYVSGTNAAIYANWYMDMPENEAKENINVIQVQGQLAF